MQLLAASFQIDRGLARRKDQPVLSFEGHEYQCHASPKRISHPRVTFWRWVLSTPGTSPAGAFCHIKCPLTSSHASPPRFACLGLTIFFKNMSVFYSKKGPCASPPAVGPKNTGCARSLRVHAGATVPLLMLRGVMLGMVPPNDPHRWIRTRCFLSTRIRVRGLPNHPA